jgi:hypothetical protein
LPSSDRPDAAAFFEEIGPRAISCGTIVASATRMASRLLVRSSDFRELVRLLVRAAGAGSVASSVFIGGCGGKVTGSDVAETRETSGSPDSQSGSPNSPSDSRNVPDQPDLQTPSPDFSGVEKPADECALGPVIESTETNICDAYERRILGNPSVCGLKKGWNTNEVCARWCGLDAGLWGVTCEVVDGQQGVSVLVCQESCAVDGRHPPDFVEGAPPLDGSLAGWFVRMAYFEAASVHAFERLALELREHGAPSGLVRDAEAAAVEEARHARIARRIARHAGATRAALGATYLRRSRSSAVRSLREVARDNAREGAARETLGTILGAYQVEHACDGQIRAALASVVADELGHAILSQRLHAWALGRLSVDDARAVEAERLTALSSLRFDPPNLSHEDLAKLGWPAPAAATRLHRFATEALAA